MNVSSVLDEIGLSEGEQKVYLALLELGETTSGPLSTRSGISASKIYQVAERLVQKGLIGESVTEGAKHFRAVHPRALLEYLQKRKERIAELEEDAKQALPQLEERYKATAQETEVQLLRGSKSMHAAFYGMLNELESKGEYNVIGANVGTIHTPWIEPFFTKFHRERTRRKVRARLLFQSGSSPVETDWRYAEKKTLPPQFKNPLQITIYKDTTLLHLIQEEPLIFKIKNQKVADSFIQYFESLWDQDTQVFRGDDAIGIVTDEVLAQDADLYLIGAHGYMPERYPETYARLIKGLEKHKRHHLSKEFTKESDFNKDPNVEAHYLPEGFLSPTVIWICGKLVVHAIWEDELTIFRIKNRKIADDYRKYFQFLKNVSKQQHF